MSKEHEAFWDESTTTVQNPIEPLLYQTCSWITEKRFVRFKVLNVDTSVGCHLCAYMSRLEDILWLSPKTDGVINWGGSLREQGSLRAGFIHFIFGIDLKGRVVIQFSSKLHGQFSNMIRLGYKVLSGLSILNIWYACYFSKQCWRIQIRGEHRRGRAEMHWCFFACARDDRYNIHGLDVQFWRSPKVRLIAPWDRSTTWICG